MRAALSRLAAAAPVPVFLAPGAGGRSPAQRLRLSPYLEVVDSPRRATVMLVVGAVAAGAAEELHRVHDQLPHPRAVLWWDMETGATAPPPLPTAERVVGDEAAVVGAVVAAHRGLLSAGRPSSPPLLADVEPNDWRGVGPFGQGGKGMTGGTPYGRPLPTRAPDRDGLELDQLVLTLGPWLPMLPAGLVVEVKLQGDVVQEVTLAPSPGLVPGAAPADVFERARVEPVPIAELELARARHHLLWAGEVLVLLGLVAESRRVLRAAVAVVPGAAAAELAHAARTAGALASARRLRHPMARVGLVGADRLGEVAGPTARASGVVTDARTDDPAYRSLGFEAVTEEAGDALARWRVRLGEAVRSLELAAEAGDRLTSVDCTPEGPRGPWRAGGPSPSTALAHLAPGLLVGLEWGDAVVALASLDLEPAELAADAARPAEST